MHVRSETEVYCEVKTKANKEKKPEKEEKYNDERICSWYACMTKYVFDFIFLVKPHRCTSTFLSSLSLFYPYFTPAFCFS